MFLDLTILATMLLLNPARTSGAKIQRYPTLHTAGKTDRILIVAPHIDDESIGAGGYAIDAIANGADVYVVFLKITQSTAIAIAAGLTLLLAMLLLWYFYPMWLRLRRA